VSHYYADDAPEKRDDTRKLWEQLMQGELEVVVSPVVYEEIAKCKTQQEREVLIDLLDELDFTDVEETNETDDLVNKYLATEVLKPKNMNDCRHIAVASIYGCMYILSWNMKHFVKRRTIEMVQDINRKLGLIQPNIFTPATFIEGDDENV